MPLRVRAWEERNGPMPENLIILPRAVQIMGQGWPVLIEAAREIKPVLVIIDTQAQSTLGVKENDNTEMSGMISKLGNLRDATGACVWTVHHIGRNGEDARGASSLDGAQDSELRVERVGGPKAMKAVIKIDKQKDAADTAEIPLRAELVDLGVDPLTGEPLSSLVVSPDLFADPFETRPWVEGLTETMILILDTLRTMFSEHGGTKGEVAKVLKERTARMRGRWASSTFYESWDKLAKRDMIEPLGGKGVRFVVVDDNAIKLYANDEATQ